MVTFLIEGEFITATIEDLDGWGVGPEDLPIGIPYEANNSYYEIIITATEGKTIVEAYYEDVDGWRHSVDIIDGTTVIFNTGYASGLYHFFIRTFVEQAEDVAGFNHVYKVDGEILKLMSNESFSDENMNPIDVVQYVLNVIELPFSLPSVLEGEENAIKLGKYILETTAIEFLDDEAVIDLGSIFVPSKYNNSYDYRDTIVKVHLPYMKTIEIPAEYVINHTLSFNYFIDLYSGSTTLNIISDRVNKVIHSESLRIGRTIPFITPNSTKDITGNISDVGGDYNGLDTVFIEVVRNVPNNLTLFNNTTVHQSTLNDVVGFIEVKNMVLNCSATFEEKNKIISLMQSGVYIK